MADWRHYHAASHLLFSFVFNQALTLILFMWCTCFCVVLLKINSIHVFGLIYFEKLGMTP